MDEKWRHIYRQLKEKEIRPEEASKQFKQLYQHKERDSETSDLLLELKKIAAEVLAIDAKEIHHDVPLSENGFDPLKLTQLADRLNNKFGLELTTLDFAEKSTLYDLVQFVQSTKPSKENSRLWEKTIDYLKENLSLLFKVNAEEIAHDMDLEKYGINSIMVLKLNQQLEEFFGPLPKTLFFEYKTLEELTGYFLQHHREALTKVLGDSQPKPASPPVVTEKHQRRSRRRPKSLRTTSTSSSDIAIVGLAGRYPGARNMQEFWANLKAGKDCVTPVPEERLDLWQTPKNGEMWGGFLQDVDRFDPLFFHISPREAERMDPQERLFLECVYETLQDAGYTRQTLGQGQGDAGKVGVFVGVMYEEYQLYGAQEQLKGRPVAVNGNAASIANRVSYFCNFHGPSMAVDTMCSSSLTAIHLACQHIQQGSCEAAIAGGVNISIHPNKYIALNQGEFLSSKGRCESFGEGGDGYVPGEGVGAVLLKPFTQAVEDGDHIYGVIKGTAVNHGGKTHGYTVPNPNAQTEVIQHALREAKIDPQTIDYIEAHGTGTALGDPIEIAGLTKAFEAYTQEHQYCAIGSVKSNIGHAESAAGIAGISKILLQLKYGQFVPSLHSEVLNQHIDFASTPFAVQQTLAEWKQPSERPRRAGISSFGAGGANAHVVIEEYKPEVEKETTNVYPGPYLIVLSAQSEGQLLEQAKQLLSVITEEGWTDQELGDIAYTLQVGREAMDERLAVVVTSVADLQTKLTDIISPKSDRTDYYRGEVKAHKAAMAVLADEDMGAILETWQQKGKYDKLLKLWVRGMPVDWDRLYRKVKPRRISLPTYPFTRERYWLPVKEQKGITEVIHPLLHRNTSDFYEQRFTARFTGEEPFLSDHVVKGERMLSGSAYLEMVRAAVSQAVGGRLEEEGLCLRQISWLRPLIVGEVPVEIHMGLMVEKNQTIHFEVYRESEEGEEVVYSEGSAELITEVASPPVDISKIKQTCGDKVLDKEDVYTAFTNIGIQYGESHRGIEKLYIGKEEVLAQLMLSSPWVEEGLHPGMVDAAIQAAIGLEADFTQLQTSVPVAMEEATIYRETKEAMWAWIRRETDGQLTIVLCDKEGHPCLEIKGLAVEVMGVPSIEDSIDHLLLHPQWQEQSVKATAASYDEHKIILCGMADLSSDHLPQFLEKGKCIELQTIKGYHSERFQQHALQLFEVLQQMMKADHKQKILVQVVIPLQEKELYDGLWAILQTAHLENPHMIGQMIAVETNKSAKEVAEKLKENALSSHPDNIRYENGKRYIANWQVLETTSKSSVLPWKEGGVYLITGGMGGLGLLFAKEIARHTSKSTLILTGRSPMDKKKEVNIQALTAMGMQVVYRQIDVTDRLAVKHFVEDILKVYGQLHGVIHSAGIIRDNFIIKKSPSQFLEVMAPKTHGLVNLDLACQDCPLDFFIIFSSLAGGMGNVGQSDYAGASAFMDAYAHYRQRLVEEKKRQGRTISFNWPLWQDGGMHLDSETEDMMRKSTGMVAMETTRGMKAFYEGLTLPYSQIMVMAGERSRFQEMLSRLPIQKAPQVDDMSVINLTPDQDSMTEKATDYIKSFLSAGLKLPTEQIESDADFMTYGMDSVVVLKLTQQLEEFFGPLPKTLFFEYKTLEELTGYFLQHHREALTKVLGDSQPKPASPPVVTEKHQRRSRRRPKSFRTTSTSSSDIAIVGLAGRYPGARNMQEFWANLKAGKDCVTPVPEERLDLWQTPKNGEMWGGFLQDVDRFDPLFFHISPREAERMDPQERLFLECVYETLQDAGYTRQTLGQGQGDAGKVGVFVGVMYEEYQLYGAQEQLKGRPVAVNGNAASIANRVSYFCNFHGPSMAVDTMCSSSLTAIHLACQHIQQGSCEAAIAGGVNISIHPNKYIALNQGEFLSSKGRCESFGEGGDGYVPGEGVGAVLLKPFTQAVEDGDHIYGVIKGTAVNHGGKTHGYTVPNPNAQTEVIQHALREAKIDPQTIDYIEAHGTGTALGDPIEIAGLTKAFEAYTQEHQYCAIGSVKSNIGHAESAAGIAGISKILLQLKYGQFVPSLHSEVLNQHIDFASTPFAVQQTLAEWKQPSERPRRAGISSFGAGGANAHVVIEEYKPEVEKETTNVYPGPYLIVLSAQSEGQLLEQAKQLLSVITEEGWTDQELGDIAYTLQVGREAMDERLAVVVTSVADLQTKLTDIISPKSDRTDYYRGEVKAHKAAMAVLADEDMGAILETWQQKGKYDKLLKLWVRGMPVDWDRLYRKVKPRRISLPTYPFTRERYWLPVKEQKGITEVIHPLLHRNTSDFYEQRFTARFTGEEPFLSDHVVKGERMLSGSAYLEMVRAAVSQAVGGRLEEEGLCLRQISWLRPLIVGEVPVEIHMGLMVEKDQTIHFEVYRESEEGEEVVYSEGSAELITEVASPPVDISKIKQTCGDKVLDKEDVYTAFTNIGIQYGESHRGIEKLYIGKEEVLAQLMLSSPWVEEGLHPGMVDAAIQAAIGLEADFTQLQTSVPVAMEEATIYRETKEAMWAWIRRETDDQLTIVLCDKEGHLCLTINGLITRVMTEEAEPNRSPGHLMLTPVWERIQYNSEQKANSSKHPVVIIGQKADKKTAFVAQQYPQAHVLYFDAETTIKGIMAKFKPIDMTELIWCMPELPVSLVTDDALISDQEQTVMAMFKVIKALLLLDYGPKELKWTIVTVRAQQIHPHEPIQPNLSALYGLAGSLANEYPGWLIRLLDLEEGDNFQPLTNIQSLPHKTLAYREEAWYHQRLIQIEQTVVPKAPYKKGGLYVVIGGAGGIGEVWSEHVIRHYQARVIWIGRREEDEAIRTKINRLATIGPAPKYITADASNKQSLEKAYQQIKQKYGEIQGVIHSAIVLRDQALVKMDEETFREALTAKVNVSVRMAQVFADESLDFVLFFSSIQSFATAAGQSNYATGCNFKDAFALAMEREWSCPVKIMNWGYWGSVGAVAEEKYQNKMTQAGIGSIEGPEGMAALDFLLSHPLPQLAYIHTLRPWQEQKKETTEILSIFQEEIIPCMDSLLSTVPKLGEKEGKAVMEIIHRMDQVQPLLVKLLWSQLQKAGWFQDEQGSLTDLTRGLQPNYGRWMEETATLFEEYKYLSREDQVYSVVANSVDNKASWQEWHHFKRIWSAELAIHSHLTLIETALENIPDILIGKVTATDILFPNSSIELVEGIYKQNAIADYYNQNLAAILVNYLQQRQLHQNNKPVRILEIGAGTGGSTEEILKQIKPYAEIIDEYAYTDISKAFLLSAEKYFGDWNKRINYRLFDVTKPLEDQRMELGKYDVVIASNVLHATPVLRETLRNTKALLKKNGLLLLTETTARTLFNHFTFGLLDGWWLYEDGILRIPGSPLVTVDQWKRILASEGFRTMVPSLVNGQQHIILAESNGVIRKNKPIDEQPKRVESRQKQVPVSSTQSTKMEDTLHSACVAYIKRLVGDILHLSSEQIDSREALERYGFDSILVTQLTSALRKNFADISSTLLFEYQTLDELADYLIKNYSQQVKDLLTIAETVDRPIHKASSPPRKVKRRLRRQHDSLRHVERQEAKSGTPLFDVAIIGIAGRYPKASNIDEYWQLLRSGKQAITKIPKERWDWRKYYDKEPGKDDYMYTKWGGFIEGIDQFDPYFFHLSPAEAKRMDPQERVFLEACYESISDAGYTPANLSKDRKIGVFVGAMNGHYPSGASYWSIANRVSYMMNFQGPSLAIDSACSSSLTAIHLALESLYSGISTCAIAGGVNLIVHPDHFLKLSAMTMLSPGSTSRPFSQKADGIVDGEGIGAVVLKPLDQAEADGDHIYGVIKGSMINAGGKTNGYTVPNPKSQAQLVMEALKRANLDPRTISYIEAHGTGTALGDPIEIHGLTTAFEKYTDDRQFCAIGSVKSNIGHSESAAGIAGLTKVLLQMKHRQLVPSLHAEDLNTDIDFKRSPFMVQQKLANWEKPVIYKDGKMQESPRRAGISSFGAGGANAHLLIEEYIPRNAQNDNMSITPNHPVIIVLSAKTEEQLTEQARRLVNAIEQHAYTDGHLGNIAFTLQTGREEMEERLAFAVSSIEDLRKQLDSFIHQEEKHDWIAGSCAAHGGSSITPEESITQWIEIGEYRSLMEAWVNGSTINWNFLYQHEKPSRISLPTYPFARERYWIEEKRDTYQNNRMDPFVYQNISDVKGLKYSVMLQEKEFYFQDHIIDGIGVLPGVVFLEMASFVAKSMKNVQGNGEVCLKDVMWAKPIRKQDVQSPLTIGISPQDDQSMTYSIYQQMDGEDNIYCDGKIELNSFSQETHRLDLYELQEQCQQRIWTGEDCYQAFQSMGIVYGPHFQGVEKIYMGERQALAKIHLPACMENKQDAYTLHPCLLDVAIQSAVGLTLSEAGQGLSLPFAMDELLLIGDCLESQWAFVRQRNSGKGIIKVDIDVCDHRGDCVLLIKGLTLKKEPVQDMILFYPDWEENEDLSTKHSFKEENGHVIIYGADPKKAKEINDQLLDEECHVIPYDRDKSDLAKQFVQDALQAFHIIQGVLKKKPTNIVPVQILLFNQSEKSFGKALGALLQTAHLENPNIVGQCVVLNDEMKSEHIRSILHANRQLMTTPQVAYQESDKRHVLTWKEVPSSERKASLPWQERGVYLITGGNGEIAKTMVQEIAQHVRQGAIILVGRSQPTMDMQQWLNEFQDSELEVSYCMLDVTDLQAVEHCIVDIKAEYGDLSGIIHGAGVTDDQFFIQKSEAQVSKVLAPKVLGTVNLDEASKDCHLDFFVIFSSIASVMGNIGQADYATANAFVDQYAYYRHSLVENDRRKGRTISINWPLWEDGGMKVTSEQKRQWKETGMVALTPNSGIRAFYQALSTPYQQVMVLAGDRDKLCHFVGEWEETKNDDKFYLNLIEQITSNELTENQFIELLQFHR